MFIFFPDPHGQGSFLPILLLAIDFKFSFAGSENYLLHPFVLFLNLIALLQNQFLIFPVNFQIIEKLLFCILLKDLFVHKILNQLLVLTAQGIEYVISSFDL